MDFLSVFIEDTHLLFSLLTPTIPEDLEAIYEKSLFRAFSVVVALLRLDFLQS